MLNAAPRILDLDGSLLRQKELLKFRDFEVVSAGDLGKRCRFWSDGHAEKSFKSLLDPARKHAPTFFGSGDFHHISSFLIEQFQQELSVIVFDHHPDWDILPPHTGCGSWVSRVLKYPFIRKVILIGVSSEDISTYNIQTADLSSFALNRLEIYPYRHAVTRVILRNVPANVSVKLSSGAFYKDVFWHELAGENLREFFKDLLGRIATPVYLSIDKDCLLPEFALTNWEPGRLSLNELLLMLGMIKEHCDIAGCDILGDYSPVNVMGRLKSVFSCLDHPQNYSAKNCENCQIDSVNASTNIKILEALL